MASLYNADLKPLASGDKTHPYDHATKLFLADNLRLAPKQSFLYYVVVNIDVGIVQNILTNSQSLTDPISSQDLIQQYEAGLMAKRVDLPKFTLGTKTLNAYNRKNIVQTHIDYDPVTITFHDDSADIITNLWNDYYTYYYRDSDYNDTMYQLPHKYQIRNAEKWGFSPRNQSLKPFFRNIQIFSLHNKRFTEYTLINPFISSWRHGEHNSYSDNETMEASMTLAYETVKYRTGYVNAVDVNGFSILHYDNFESPISTSTTNIFTDAGFIGSVEGSTKDLARPDGKIGSGDVLSNVLSAYRFYNGIKNANFGSIVSTTIGQVGAKIINGAINGAIGGSYFPTLGGVAGYSGVYGSSQVYNNLGISSISPYASPITNLGATIASTASSIVVGSAINVTNQLSTQLTNDLTRGISTATNGLLSAPATNNIYDTRSTSRFVQLDEWGRPIAGQGTIATTVTNSQGAIVAQQSSFTPVTGKIAGDYDVLDPNKNAIGTESTINSSGLKIETTTYSGGTRVVREVSADGSKRDLQIIPSAPTNQILNPNNNTPQSATNLYRDTRTGIIYDRSGTLGAQVQNTVSATTGAITGLYAGQQLNQALTSGALGKTVLGRAVSAGASGVVGAQVGVWTNNGAQLVLNKISGYASQAWDQATGSISDVVGGWFGSGGYNSSNPTVNLVSTGSPDASGNQLYTYKDGTKVTFDVFGDKVSEEIPASSTNAWNSSNWASGIFGPSTDSTANQPTGTTFTDNYGNPIATGYGGTWNNTDLSLDTYQLNNQAGNTDFDSYTSWEFPDNIG